MYQDLEQIATQIRRHILHMAAQGRTPHIGSALSCVELLVALYFHTLHIDPHQPEAESRDRFILSKGHGAMAWYATLAERGYFPTEALAHYAQNASDLGEHPSRGCAPGIEVTSGSLGHGLAIGVGMALAARNTGAPWRVFVLLSDGECEEGSIWEAAMIAAHHRLDNLIVLVDYNKMQAMGHTANITALAPLAAKWQAFEWEAHEVDGHDLPQIITALEQAPFTPQHPSVLIAHTIKGKGVSFMEDQILWHYKPPDARELAAALAELEQPA